MWRRERRKMPPPPRFIYYVFGPSDLHINLLKSPIIDRIILLHWPWLPSPSLKYKAWLSLFTAWFCVCGCFFRSPLCVLKADHHSLEELHPCRLPCLPSSQACLHATEARWRRRRRTHWPTTSRSVSSRHKWLLRWCVVCICDATCLGVFPSWLA